MKRIVSLVVAAVLLSGCAADISSYTPPLDPDLVTAQTPDHLAHCRQIVQAQAPSPFSKADIHNATRQTFLQSFGPWVTAAELWSATAAEAAGAFTIFGAILGIRANDTSNQSQAESNVRQCMANYHEPITEKP